jgi:2-keto-3-deoxy-L-rhamnonate aldolase RhmA
MEIIPNATLRRLRQGETVLGFGVHHLRTAAVPMLAAATGHDWLFIDTEHGAFTVHEASQICLSALSAGVTPIVRICADALDEGTRALDNGAQGIVVPHVDTPTQAKRAAEAFRFPPVGHRSWGGPPYTFRLRPPAIAEAQTAINDEVLAVVMIETEEAVSNADKIAAVDGIDVLLFGTSDLTTDMGIPGEIGHERVRAAYAAVGEACRRHGKVLGMGGVYDEENTARYIGMGARFLLAGGDHAYLMAAGTARTAFVRGLAGQQAAPAARPRARARTG